MKQKYFNRPLVAGCIIGYKPRPIHVIEWDARQTKKTNFTLKYFFSVNVGSSYHADVCTSVSYKFGFS